MKVKYNDQEIEIPENATIEVVNGDFVIIPKKNKFIPKDGDFVRTNRFIAIYKKATGIGYDFFDYVEFENDFESDDLEGLNYESHLSPKELRLATEEEKQKLLDALHKDGKDWDSENKKIVDYRWRAKFDEYYFYINDFDIKIVKTTEQNFNFDILRYKNGNYFQTEQQAEQALGKIKEILKTIK